MGFFSIQRTHSGPSEEWVRRTYSPTASPNSSILKRTHQTPQLISPDSSPPSSKVEILYTKEIITEHW